MAVLNPEYIEAIREILREAPYFNLIGMDLKTLVPGRCEFRLETGKRHLQPFGVIHGGVLASILDAACFWSVFSLLEQNMALTTTDLKVNYLAPVPAGKDLLVTGRSIKVGRTLCLAQAEAQEKGTGKIIGFATSTLMIIESTAKSGFQDLPEKFVI